MPCALGAEFLLHIIPPSQKLPANLRVFMVFEACRVIF